jgi:superfamily I DNA/RNA helicase
VRANPAQQDAIVSDESLLICACPGSGKTTVLSRKARRTLTERPDARIVLTTFSRDAADELLRRIAGAERGKAADGGVGRRIKVGTFHSLALGQIRTLGWDRHLLTGMETDAVVNRALHDARIESMSIKDATALIEAIKSNGTIEGLEPIEKKLFSAYQSQLSWRGAVDFIDLINHAVEQMEIGHLQPIPGTHIMVDEFQDCDLPQFRWLMQHLADGRIGVAVGDDDQSIFGFRRARGYAGMMDFVAATGARVVTLDTNYRSTARILDHASQLIGRNIDRIRKTPVAARGDGIAPIVVPTESRETQNAFIAQEILKLCAGNARPEGTDAASQDEGTVPVCYVEPEQVAVLARTNYLLSEVERALTESRIPCHRLGRSLWDDQTVQVFLALLKALHARASTGIEVALKWADPRLAQHGMAKLADRCGGDLWNLVDPAIEAPEALPTPAATFFVQVVRRLAERLHDTAQAARDDTPIRVIEGAYGWMKVVIKQDTEFGLGLCDVERVHNGAGKRLIDRQLRKLTLARDILLRQRGSLPQRITTAMQRDERDYNRVVLSTWHGAKGLEWRNVFLIDVNDGQVPHPGAGGGEGEDPDLLTDAAELARAARRSALIEAQEAEERRLFYVAMTRAKDRLYICHERGKPSRFLDEAGLFDPVPAEPPITPETVET